jgi:hypothetical protein
LRARFSRSPARTSASPSSTSIEEQSSNLANLYVASYQLHTSRPRRGADRDQEIVINLIGSERLAIYERDGDAGYRLAASFGLDQEQLLPLVNGEYAVEARRNTSSAIRRAASH